MLNKIEAYKNTGVIPQKITIECTDIELSHVTFYEMAKKIFESVNANDTLNPYNTYNIKTYNINGEMGLNIVDEKDWDDYYYIDFEISFCEAGDLNTTYSTGMTNIDFGHFTEEIEGVIYRIYNNDYYDETAPEITPPPIIITDAKITIDTWDEDDDNTEVVGG